jgi:hypothetical protein
VLHKNSKTGGQRAKQLLETVNVCKKRFGFSALEWIERLADMELSGADGILEQSDRSSSIFATKVSNYFLEFNSSRQSMAAIWSKPDCPEVANTFRYMREQGPGHEIFIATAFDSRFFHSGLTLIAGLHISG